MDSWLELMASDPDETWTEQTKLYDRHLWKGPVAHGRGRNRGAGGGGREAKRQREEPGARPPPGTPAAAGGGASSRLRRSPVGEPFAAAGADSESAETPRSARPGGCKIRGAAILPRWIRQNP